MKQREHEVLNKPDCAAKLPKVSSEATLFAVAANRRMSEKILAVFGRLAVSAGLLSDQSPTPREGA
jgi:hypothetical protein